MAVKIIETRDIDEREINKYLNSGYTLLSHNVTIDKSDSFVENGITTTEYYHVHHFVFVR